MKVIFVEKLATDCRPGPATLLKMDFFKVVNRYQAFSRTSIFLELLSMAASATNVCKCHESVHFLSP